MAAAGGVFHDKDVQPTTVWKCSSPKIDGRTDLARHNDVVSTINRNSVGHVVVAASETLCPHKGTLRRVLHDEPVPGAVPPGAVSQHSVAQIDCPFKLAHHNNVPLMISNHPVGNRLIPSGNSACSYVGQPAQLA